jgi:hypothetical protein
MNCAPNPPPIMPAIESSHTASAQGRPHCGICRVATPPSVSRQMVVFSALQSFAAVKWTARSTPVAPRRVATMKLAEDLERGGLEYQNCWRALVNALGRQFIDQIRSALQTHPAQLSASQND